MWSISWQRRVSIRAMRRSKSGRLTLFLNGFCVWPAVSEAGDAINPLSLVFSFDMFWYFIVFKVFNSSAFKLVWSHAFTHSLT